jgi:hypothetical protein
MRDRVFRPYVVLPISFASALLFAIWIALRFDGERRTFLLYYFVPIGVPFVAYLLDRAAARRELSWLQWGIDLPIIALALVRAVFPVPLISGHMLFLTYALLSTRSWVARGTAALVLLEVTYLKLCVWHDRTTFLGGVLLGGLAALGHYGLRRRPLAPQANPLREV